MLTLILPLMPDSETLAGYVVDIICLRKYPVGEYAERAKKHTRACALEGHCVESGFALVGDDGRAALLDPEATVQVVEAIRGSDREAGIRLRVRREEQEGEMQTASVEAINPSL